MDGRNNQDEGFIIATLVFPSLSFMLRWLANERGLDAIGSLAILDALLSLSLASSLLLLSTGLGNRLLGHLQVTSWNNLEQNLFSVALGMGILGMLMLALGASNLISRPAIMTLLVLLTVFAWPGIALTIRRLPSLFSDLGKKWSESNLGTRLFLVLLFVMFIINLSLALTPPFDYDALMYHLQVPRLYLEAGGIIATPEIWQANGPFLLEMIYVIGMAFGSETLAKLIHFSFAIILALALYAFGRRYCGKRIAGLAVAILLGLPILGWWAVLPYVEMAWGVFSFLAMYALIFWKNSGNRSWLLLSGSMLGLALGVKILALGSALAFGIWLVANARPWSDRRMATAILLFVVAAALIALPWYLKSWIWTGNPVFPSFWGGLDWTEAQVEAHMAYHRSFGTGRGIADFVFLPFTLYLENQAFSTLKGAEFPNLLFLFAVFYPFSKRDRVLDAVGLMTLLQFVAWAFASQQIRFLLPLFPSISLLAANVFYVAVESRSIRRFQKPLRFLLPGAFLGISLGFQLLLWTAYSPHVFLLGNESRDSFLSRTVNSYPAFQFIMGELSETDRVILLWEGRGYYCDDRCWPDPALSRAMLYYQQYPDIGEMAGNFESLGISHVYYNEPAAAFVLQHDPTGGQHGAHKFYLQEFLPACGDRIYQDQHVQIFRLVC